MARNTNKKRDSDDQSSVKVVARNRRALHAFHVEETVEAGIVLVGTEVKSLRNGLASIRQAFARIDKGEAWIIGAHIPEYGAASWTNHDPDRRRKLLLHRRQLRKLSRAVQIAGRTIIPLQLHFNERGIAKVLLALVTGKRRHDKRADAAKREAQREISRTLRGG